MQAGKLSARTPRLAMGIGAGKATGVATPRLPQQKSRSGWGSYRPVVGPESRPQVEGKFTQSADEKEFHQLLELIGRKCGEKFSKGRDAFRFIDGNHDGMISQSEVRFFFRFFNIVPEKADKFFARIDEDGSGEVSNLEFIRYIWPYINPGNEQQPWQLTAAEKEGPPPLLGCRTAEAKMHALLAGQDLPAELRVARIRVAQRLEVKYNSISKAFLDLDTDCDGFITKKDVRNLFASFDFEDAADQFFDLVDQDASGAISFNEFASIFNKDLDGLRMKL